MQEREGPLEKVAGSCSTMEQADADHCSAVAKSGWDMYVNMRVLMSWFMRMVMGMIVQQDDDEHDDEQPLHDCATRPTHQSQSTALRPGAQGIREQIDIDLISKQHQLTPTAAPQGRDQRPSASPDAIPC